jgi:hypothetical protein
LLARLQTVLPVQYRAGRGSGARRHPASCTPGAFRLTFRVIACGQRAGWARRGVSRSRCNIASNKGRSGNWRIARWRRCIVRPRHRNAPCLPRPHPTSSSPSPAPSRGASLRRLPATPEGDALAEAAQAIWRGVEVLEGTERRKPPGEARSMNFVHRALSATPIPRRVSAD